uniref:Immunoglobulin V-set domain-containing protein n=1 Tax=Fundulus heteroclitus TaxID=8078 RepID=A0A3Q2Q9E4_FUNHE
VFVQTGKDLILNLTEAEFAQNSTFWSWGFERNSLVTCVPPSPPTVVNTYTGRIEVLEKTYNVKLKNLQKSHSGIYTAKAAAPIERILTEYNVTVQDPVSSADLTINRTFNTSSRIFTVTCRAGNSSISSTLRCENKTCGEIRGVTASGSSLHIYQLKESIICNHSNQVSFNNSVEEIEDYCPQDVGKTS